MTREIPLTKGYTAIVDDADYEAVSRFKWQAHVHKYRVAVYAARGTTTPEGKPLMILLHRFILGVTLPEVVDHIDGNGLNCTRRNLRVCTDAENKRNAGLSKANRSGFKGVYWVPNRQRWYAQISLNNHITWVGSFNTPEEAAIARDSKARELHGAFAFLNFPDMVVPEPLAALVQP